MANINSVVVLAPNGRRQTVKVTPNSTVLHVLEEVCNKHDFDPQEYDIRHHTRVLDATMTVQYSRLPNNAQLEMVKAKKIRRESEVLVNVQMESGSRLSGSFLPSDSLWDVITEVCQDIEIVGKHPAVIYMRQEICGVTNLKSTTLRSLGLTSGRALLRLMYKSIEGDAPKQSNVASSHNNTILTSVSEGKESSMNVDPQSSGRTTLPSIPSELGEPSVKQSLHSSLTSKQPPADVSKKESVSHKEIDEPVPTRHSPSEDKVPHSKKVCKEKDSSSSKSVGTDVQFSYQESTDMDSLPSSSVEDIFSTPIEPRDRNPVVFKRGEPMSAPEDLPDEFFELTIHDVRYLYRDLRNKRSEMNETPLLTDAVRKLEESKRILNALHKYKRAVLRIQFPDQTVLQGSFSPVETIENVQDFVRGYLQDPSMEFYLYTTPPKVILTPSDRLIEVNCVPCAVLHFGLSVDAQENVTYLRPEFLSELSSQEAATAVASHSRGFLAISSMEHSLPSANSGELVPFTSSVQSASSAPSTSGTQQPVPSTSGAQQSAPSTSGTHTSRENEKNTGMPSNNAEETKQTGNPNGKVPKWFKMTPK